MGYPGSGEMSLPEPSDRGFIERKTDDENDRLHACRGAIGQAGVAPGQCPCT